MKNQIKALIMVIGLGLTNFVNANTIPTGKTYSMNFYKVVNAKEIKLFLNKVKGSTLLICLKDNNGKELFSERIYKNDETYRTKFDMSALASGKYKLEIKEGDKVEVNTILLENERIKTRILTLK